MSSYTLITLFDECSYRKLYSVLGNVNFDNLCRVPYGRVSDDLRCLLDTLPLHFTISSSKDGLSDIMEKMGAPDKPCGVGRADANPKLLLNDT